MIGSADENALEEEGRQQAVFLPTRNISSKAHRCRERDAAKGAGTNPHVLWRQVSKGLLCLAHSGSSWGSLVQYPSSVLAAGKEEDRHRRISCSRISRVPAPERRTETTRRSMNGTTRSRGVTSGMCSPRTLSATFVSSRQNSLCA